MNNTALPPHLLEKLSKKGFNHLLNRQELHSSLHLFTDYDGTLAPFKADPSQAYPLPGAGRLLLELDALPNILVTVITGREPEDVRKFLASKEIPVAGLHGLTYLASGSDKREFLGGNDRSLPSKVKGRIRQMEKEYSGVNLENKGGLLALHWTPESRFSPDRAREELEEMLDDAGWEMLQGRQVLEVRPAGWHKGKAVDYLRRRLAANNSGQEMIATQPEIPAVYLGDDTTDEDVFQSFTRPGFTVYIKNEDELETAADYYLKDPLEVRNFLEQILQEVQKKTG